MARKRGETEGDEGGVLPILRLWGKATAIVVRVSRRFRRLFHAIPPLNDGFWSSVQQEVQGCLGNQRVPHLHGKILATRLQHELPQYQPICLSFLSRFCLFSRVSCNKCHPHTRHLSVVGFPFVSRSGVVVCNSLSSNVKVFCLLAAASSFQPGRSIPV